MFQIPSVPGDSVVWGGYFAISRAAQLHWGLRTNTASLAQGCVALDDRWSKAGGHAFRSGATGLLLELLIPPHTALDVWGLDAGEPAPNIGKATIDLKTVLAGNLTPESFYLAHEAGLNLDLSEDAALPALSHGRDVVLKKCSYCGRLLPIDPERLGAIAFHKHNAKRTKHQNECLSCKKWKINDDFNPTRSTDQLHESSVITRERKLFLREPERLKEFKDRNNNTGLRSYIWNKFGRRCFVCKTPVGIDEFQLDHTRPMAYLWPIDEFATCLCAVHNNEKKDKFALASVPTHSAASTVPSKVSTSSIIRLTDSSTNWRTLTTRVLYSSGLLRRRSARRVMFDDLTAFATTASRRTSATSGERST
ncbi:hypothetical protein [Hydrogenophaga sp.]|uniref:hypothetical protein n=1 Tax=Hydrogenophaga sp. TaxID=1904254 RepID=UPI0035B131D3